MEKSKSLKRIIGLDLVRVVAIFFVVSVHYLLRSSFYKTNMSGISMLILTMMRWLFYTCVPLFIIITGYLKSNKKLTKDHYKSIKHILISYLIYSFIAILVLKYYLHEPGTLKHYLLGVLNFSTINYAWYLEMYIGLFLLIPFLNILYHNLESKKNKQILIATLIFIVSAPSLFNTFKINSSFLDILPNWWFNLYPLLYYFIGCYIKEYSIKIPKIKNLIYIIIVVALEGIITFLYSKGGRYTAIYEGYFAFPTLALSTLIFLFFYNINIKQEKVCKVISDVSKLSFEMFLLSFVTDKIVYSYFSEFLIHPRSLIINYLWLVPLNFFTLYILVKLKSIIENLIIKITSKIKKGNNIVENV